MDMDISLWMQGNYQYIYMYSASLRLLLQVNRYESGPVASAETAAYMQCTLSVFWFLSLSMAMFEYFYHQLRFGSIFNTCHF